MLFERAHGLLPIDRLSRRCVAVFGLGAVGSFAAWLLAKSGVGRFLLVEPDVVAEENIPRTVYGHRQLGCAKTQAMAEEVLDINPGGRIVAIMEAQVQSVGDGELTQVARAADLLFVAIDDPPAQFLIDDVSYALTPAVYVALGRQAVRGEIIFMLPRATPCLRCVARARTGGRGGQLRREPGLGADFFDVTIKAVKVALGLLAPDGVYGRLIDPSRSLILVGNRGREGIFAHCQDATVFPSLSVRTSALSCGRCAR